MATAQPQILAAMPTQRASQARYAARLRCPSDTGHFVAQINWDAGAPYYRLVACSAGVVAFAESVPIPARARQGLVYLTVRDSAPVLVEDVQVTLY